MNRIKPKKVIISLISFVIQSMVAIIGLAVITFLFYSANWSSINAFSPIGTDSFSAFTYVEWINRFYPNVPYWYPLQGAGVSFVAAYPFLAHYIVVLFHHLTNISLIRSFNIVEFSAFFITAIGIFIYCWTRLDYPKNKVARQAIGITAATFYLIAPITYVFANPWGFYAETVSYMFTGPTLILLDYFIDKHFKGEHDWKKRVALLFGMIFYTITFLTHFSTGVGLTNVLFILIIGRMLKNPLKTDFKKSLINGFTAGACIYISLTGLFSWRLANFQDYSAEVAKGGFAGYANPTVKLSDITETHTLHLKQVLGFDYYPDSDPRKPMNNWALQPFIWIFAAIGGTIGALRSKKMALFGLMSTYGLLTLSLPIVLFILSRIGVFAELFNARSVWTVYRMIVPILAAYGVYTLCELPFIIIDKLITKVHPLIQFNWSNVLKPAIVISMMSLLTFYVTVYTNPAKVEKGRDTSKILRIGIGKVSRDNLWKQVSEHNKIIIHDPNQNKDVDYDTDLTYTPEELYFFCKNYSGSDNVINSLCDKAITKRTNKIELLQVDDLKIFTTYCTTDKHEMTETKFNFCNTLNKLPLAYQLNPKNWPRFNVTKPDFSDYKKEAEFFSLIPDKPLDTRYDLSGLAGSIIMRAPLLTNASQTQVYINNLNLFSALWNYQSSVMYSDQPINQKPGVISELAKYFGYEYIYQATNSEVAKSLFDNDQNWENADKPNWRHFKNPTTLTTWTSKPAVLFIGNKKTFLYDQFFKTANLGILPYDKATLFAGKTYVDDYSLDELNKFNVLFLEGYNYHDQANGHDLLDNYVKNGGNLFIDTGWQYESPDWELKSASAFFPTNNLVWKEAAPRSKMTLDQAGKIGMDTENKDAGYLTNLDSAWGISSPQDIRDGANVILQSNNIPLIISKIHGKGRVVWSGMNIVPHIEGGKNENAKEIEVLKYSLQWLLENNTNNINDYHVSVKRPSPDIVQFTLNDSTESPTTLYWRESYYPKWHAYLNSATGKKEVNLYQAGPRLTGMRLPKMTANQTITMQIENTPKEIALNVLSLLTISYLVLYALGITGSINRTVHYYIWKTKDKLEIAKSENASFKVHEDPSEE